MAGGGHIRSHPNRCGFGTDHEAGPIPGLLAHQERDDPKQCTTEPDIGDRWDEDSDRLHNWGILR